MFLTTYIYLGMIWSDFIKIDFFRFFDPQKIFLTYICGRNSDFPAKIGQKMFGMHFLTFKHFSKKMEVNNSKPLLTYHKKCEKAIFDQNGINVYIIT